MAWCIAMLLQGLGGTINLCGIGHHSGIVAAILALLVVVFLWRLLFFGGGTINVFGFGFGGLSVVEVAVVGDILGFCIFFSAAFCSTICASALFYVPWHFTLCRGTVFCALCHGTVYVKQHWLCSVVM